MDIILSIFVFISSVLLNVLLVNVNDISFSSAQALQDLIQENGPEENLRHGFECKNESRDVLRGPNEVSLSSNQLGSELSLDKMWFPRIQGKRETPWRYSNEHRKKRFDQEEPTNCPGRKSRFFSERDVACLLNVIRRTHKCSRDHEDDSGETCINDGDENNYCQIGGKNITDHCCTRVDNNESQNEMNCGDHRAEENDRVQCNADDQSEEDKSSVDIEGHTDPARSTIEITLEGKRDTPHRNDCKGFLVEKGVSPRNQALNEGKVCIQTVNIEEDPFDRGSCSKNDNIDDKKNEEPFSEDEDEKDEVSDVEDITCGKTKKDVHVIEIGKHASCKFGTKDYKRLDCDDSMRSPDLDDDSKGDELRCEIRTPRSESGDDSILRGSSSAGDENVSTCRKYARPSIDGEKIEPNEHKIEISVKHNMTRKDAEGTVSPKTNLECPTEYDVEQPNACRGNLTGVTIDERKNDLQNIEFDKNVDDVNEKGESYVPKIRDNRKINGDDLTVEPYENRESSGLDNLPVGKDTESDNIYEIGKDLKMEYQSPTSNNENSELNFHNDTHDGELKNRGSSPSEDDGNSGGINLDGSESQVHRPQNHSDSIEITEPAKNISEKLVYPIDIDDAPSIIIGTDGTVRYEKYNDEYSTLNVSATEYKDVNTDPAENYINDRKNNCRSDDIKISDKRGSSRRSENADSANKTRKDRKLIKRNRKNSKSDEKNCTRPVSECAVKKRAKYPPQPKLRTDKNNRRRDRRRYARHHENHRSTDGRNNQDICHEDGQPRKLQFRRKNNHSEVLIPPTLRDRCINIYNCNKVTQIRLYDDHIPKDQWNRLIES